MKSSLRVTPSVCVSRCRCDSTTRASHGDCHSSTHRDWHFKFKLHWALPVARTRSLSLSHGARPAGATASGTHCTPSHVLAVAVSLSGHWPRCSIWPGPQAACTASASGSSSTLREAAAARLQPEPAWAHYDRVSLSLRACCRSAVESESSLNSSSEVTGPTSSWTNLHEYTKLTRTHWQVSASASDSDSSLG